MIRQVLLFLIGIGYCLSATGQHCVVSGLKQNVLYIGVPNPVDIAVEGRWCKDLTVSMENGKITPTEHPCSYLVAPERQGRTELIVRDRKSAKILGRAEFRVKFIPDPIAMVGGKSGGEIRKEALMAQAGIIAHMTGFDFDARFLVLGYTVTTYRKNEVLFTQAFTGPVFPAEVTDAFSALHTHDKVMFSEMSYRAPDGRKGQLLPIEFRIVE